ncbi:phosphonate ABC transporter, permease protein PhnE [Mesorhizobium sp. NBSH29]|nr:phosphonate ABC transporter, permease protein PhnE [Mesorhizobium sp. NBSH29]QPC88536.1 phosphonate ABC transporter, permease protein PhnE [Mesorhizobium sp. NBSH29]
MSAAEIDAISNRHPAVFAGSTKKLFIGWLVTSGIIAYLVFAWWFFSVGAVLAAGNWNIASTYLADWISYEVRPTAKFRDGKVQVGYARFATHNSERQPEWVSIAQGPADKPGTGESAEFSIAESQISVTPQIVTVRHGTETLIADIVYDQSVTARGPLPVWATQREPGGKINVAFGFSGQADIEADEVKIRQRFIGWENFVFDGNSPFWGKSAGEVFSLMMSDVRIKPQMSNAALAWDNIWNNANWQHGDVWVKLLQTIVMAFVGTLFASIVAFPLAFLAARNITRNRPVNQVLKRFFDFLRSVDMLIWALFFTRAFGPGPLAGISAIFFTDTGTFGKLYSEALENIDDKQREGIRSVGAAPVLVQRYGVVPQVLPVLLSQSLYFWESNTRSATIIGAVGAGGIGLKLWEAMRTNSNWANVFYMVILILIVVFVFDTISSKLRKRLIGGAMH